MKKCFKKALSGILATAMLFSSAAFTPVTVSAATGFTTVGGWNESLYAEWQDSNPDSTAVKVGYKLNTDTNYTYLSGDDLTYLVRPASTSGLGRVDIPGLKAGRYDLTVTDSTGSTFTRTGIKVYPNDRSGYAHWKATEGVGAYNNDGTPKDNAIIVYVTDENKNTVTIPGYGNQTINYVKSTGETWTRDTAGIGDILNNNYNFIKQVTVTDNHPLIIRFIGTVNPPENLTPHGAKDTALGGSTSDNGNLAITKDARNITLEGVGPDATIFGWGFTFSKSSTAPAETDRNFEVSNLTFKNYPEDALAFQGHDSNPLVIERCWVHNNTFYPGYCANPTESDKAEGDGSCDFKRGMYYTLAYNHFVKCHKTNLLGSGTSDDQWYMTLHHNWYESVGSRQPLEANGNVHIYSTYFQGATSTTVDARGSNATFLEENYYDNCKNYYKSRNNTCVAKSYNEIINGGSLGSVSGKRTVVSSRTEAAIASNGYNFPNGDAMTNFDTNPTHFYYDSVNKVSDVEVLTPAAEVPAYVMAHAGTLQPYEETESGDIIITVKSGSTPITGAKLTAAGLTFSEQGNGVYTAAASIGATYTIVVSKEGYSNVTINTTAINTNGGTFTATADMTVDTDGYAVVQLIGGTEGVPVNGATVKLNDGTVLVDQGDGIYKSANQIAVGTYTATITNTGDYIAPTSAVSITVKTTDEETVVNLAKYTGTVNVTVTPASGETNVPDLTKATVTVGDTVLTYNNGAFTGDVEIGNPYTVTVKMPGWNTDSVTPATLTANRTSAVSAAAVISYKGDALIWNYTDSTNTLNATVSANEWSSASSNPQTFEDKTLTKAIKMESSTSLKFTADTDGILTVVMYSTNTSPTISIDGTAYDVEPTGATEIPIAAGTHEIKKGTSSTYMYYAQFAPGGSSTPGETTTKTEATTEVTTKTTTETTTKNTEVPVEPTTSAPVVQGQLYKFYVNADDAAANGDAVADNATGVFTNASTGTGSLSAASTITVDGKSYTLSKRTSNGSHSLTIVVPSGVTNATLYLYGNSSGSGARTLTFTDGASYTNTGSVAGTAGNLVTFTGLNAGTYTLTASGNWGYSFLALSVPKSGSDDTTKATTEATTEATTKATTEATTKATTEATTKEDTTESTTQTPVEGVQISVDGVTAKVGEQITIPVRLTGVTTLASFDVNVAFDSANITVNSVTAGDMLTDSNAKMSYNIGSGIVSVTGSNPVDTIASGKDILFNLVITPNTKGDYTLTVTVDEIYVSEGTPATVTAKTGTVTVEEVGPTIVKGDADNNGKVEKADVTMIMQYVVGIIEKVTNPEAADVNEDSKVSSSDAYLIQKFLNTGKWN